MPGLEKNLNFSLPRLGQTAIKFSLPQASFNLLFLTIKFGRWLFEGGNYFKHFRQRGGGDYLREVIIRGMAIIEGNTVLARQEILLSQTSWKHSFWVLKHDIWRLLLKPTTFGKLDTSINKVNPPRPVYVAGQIWLQVNFHLT